MSISFRARLMPLVQRLRGSKKRYSSVELTAARIDERLASRTSFEPSRLDGLIVEREDFGGWPVFAVSAPSPSGREALYFHGGSFVFEISPRHWALVAELVRDTGATIRVAIYPLAPLATASEIVPVAVDLVASRADIVGASAVTIMGDSAGGDIALAAAMVLRDRGAEPSRTVLISPILDLALEDPRMAEIAPRDPWLAVPGVAYASGLYRGLLDARDPLVSPLHGSLAGLAPVTLFSGTRDILNADAVRLVALAAEAGVELDYHEAPGMIHVYPLLPIREARPARAVMKAVLRGGDVGRRA